MTYVHPANTTFINQPSQHYTYSNVEHPVHNEHTNAASSRYQVPSVFTGALQAHPPSPSFSTHHIPTTVPRPPTTVPRPPSSVNSLPSYQSRPPSVVEVEVISDSEDEEGSVTGVDGAALAHQVRSDFFIDYLKTMSNIYSSNNQHRFLLTIGHVMVPLAHRPCILSLHKAPHHPQPLANTICVPVPFQPLVEFQLQQRFLTISSLPRLLGL